MPAEYAHVRMGKEVQEQLSGRMRQAVDAYPQLFFIGVHGPDILFFYKPLTKTKLRKEGTLMHERSGRVFFAHAKEVLLGLGGKDNLAALSYVCGFLCHFALDVTAHGAVFAKTAKDGTTHSEIEAEFDRMLLVMDGKDPIRQSLVTHIVPSMENAKVISPFYIEEGTPAEIKKALKGMIFYSNIFVCPTKLKRAMVTFLLKVSGNYEGLHGKIINYEKNPVCNDICEELMGLYEKAVVLGVRLIMEYEGYLDGKGSLEDPVYGINFDSDPVTE